MTNAYRMTLVPDSPWRRFSATTRRRLIHGLWLITEAGLLAGLVDQTYWTWVLGFTIAHAALFLGLVGFRPMAFPAQLRIAYVAWLAVGIYVPNMTWMMYVTTVGLTVNLIIGYCPLSRLLYLLPWNRQISLSPRRVAKTFLSAPTAGRFQLRPEPS